MKVSVDKDLCIGSGNCEATCPEVFEVRDEKAHVKVDKVPEDQEDKAQQAIDGCPSGAITKS